MRACAVAIAYLSGMALGAKKHRSTTIEMEVMQRQDIKSDVEAANEFFNHIRFRGCCQITTQSGPHHREQIQVVRHVLTRKAVINLDRCFLGLVPRYVPTHSLWVSYLSMESLYSWKSREANLEALEKAVRILDMAQDVQTIDRVEIVYKFGAEYTQESGAECKRAGERGQVSRLEMQEAEEFISSVLENQRVFQTKHNVLCTFIDLPVVFPVEFKNFVLTKVLSISKYRNSSKFLLDMHHKQTCLWRTVQLVPSIETSSSLLWGLFSSAEERVEVEYSAWRKMHVSRSLRGTSPALKTLHVYNVPLECGFQYSLGPSPEIGLFSTGGKTCVLEIATRGTCFSHSAEGIKSPEFPLQLLSWICSSFSSSCRIHVFLALPQGIKPKTLLSQWFGSSSGTPIILDASPHTVKVTFSVSFEGIPGVYKCAYSRYTEEDLKSKEFKRLKCICFDNKNNGARVKPRSLASLWEEKRNVLLLEKFSTLPEKT